MKIGTKFSWVVQAAQEINEKLESEIAATPTGENRNRLCDANIHILAALDLLKKAETNETSVQLPKSNK